MGNSCKSVFPNSSECEQQEWNNKETYEEGKKRGASMEISNVGTKKKSPNGLSLPNQNTIITNVI